MVGAALLQETPEPAAAGLRPAPAESERGGHAGGSSPLRGEASWRIASSHGSGAPGAAAFRWPADPPLTGVGRPTEQSGHVDPALCRPQKPPEIPSQSPNRLRKAAEKGVDACGAARDNHTPASGRRFPPKVERVENVSGSPGRFFFSAALSRQNPCHRQGSEAVLPFSPQPSTAV